MRETAMRGKARMARAAVFGVVAVALAAAAHVSAGGAVPSLPVLALLSVFAGWPGVAITGRRLRALPTVGVLLGLAALLHEAFMALGGMTGCAAGAATTHMHGMAGMAGMHHATMGSCAA